MKTETQFTRYTIFEYLTEIKAIFASIEIELATYDLDHLSEIRPLPAFEQYGKLKIGYAMMLVNKWLEGTEFSTQHGFFWKKDKEVKWTDMLKVIDAKILEYYNGEPVIEITLTENGRIERTVNGRMFFHDFDGEQRPEIIRKLVDESDYYPTSELQKAIHSKSLDSTYKAINSINDVLRAKLYLPKNFDLIDSKRTDGQRINPIYNVILVK